MELVTKDLNNGVIYLIINYSDNYLFTQESRLRIREELVNSYQKMLADNPDLQTKSCIVEIKASTASSRLVRALFELWKKVNIDRNSQLICVGYPEDYIDSLISLGLTSLDNFNLALTKDEAFKQLGIR